MAMLLRGDAAMLMTFAVWLGVVASKLGGLCRRRDGS
jgi:hypothetical protein